jgi:choline dehydrogenase-like flavoprotein
MKKADFVVVGSSGGGGTIAWLLARAGYNVTVLEQGSDWAEPLQDEPQRPDDLPGFNRVSHDEFRYRLDRPEVKRHPRGDYNTFREKPTDHARPFGLGWTGTMLGGGSVIWGVWSFRALPIDFQLATLFGKTDQLSKLKEWGYSIVDWPVTYREMSPYYNVAETLLSVCGDRDEVHRSITKSHWYKPLDDVMSFDKHEWHIRFPFPSKPFPLTPVGYAVQLAMEKADCTVASLPSGMVRPGSGTYSTRAAIADALAAWHGQRPEFWEQSADEIWSERVRDACNMCGYCGEYLCWGKTGPKSGARSSTIEELKDLPNVKIITNARAYEVVYDQRTRRATGVRYLDTTTPEHPVPRLQEGHFVIVACGAVQSARLLMLSGPAAGLGNAYDQVGRYATFHLFGLGISAVLPPKFQGLVHGEFGHTGNTMTFEHYFMKNPDDGKWWKGGTMVSTAKKNPLENATGAAELNRGAGLIKKMEEYARGFEVRFTGDDLPRPSNRVDLDPRFVDEHGFPVARITRAFGPAEQLMFKLAMEPLSAMIKPFNIDPNVAKPTPAKLTLIGDHQMGTCRMGDDPRESVVDRYCRVHQAPNVFVVDTSFMPSGLGLNPMVTVVANALRVGTWIVQEGVRGTDLESDRLSG